MAIDFATLEIKAKFSDIDNATRALEKLRTEGAKAEKQTDAVGGATVRAGTASRTAAGHIGAWDAIQKQATGHTGEHSLALGRLERNLAGVAERALGLNSTLGLVSSSLLKFGLGTIETVGILAGIAAIAAAWEYFTGAERRAREESEKLRESLEKGNFMAKLGPDPDLVLQTNEQRNEIRREESRRRLLLNFGVKPDDDRITALNVSIAHGQHELEEGEARLFKARMDAGKPLDTVVTKAKDYTAELAKQEALLIRHNEEMARMYGGSPFSMNREQRADWLSAQHGRGMSDRERADVMAPFNIAVPSASIPMDAVHQLTNSYDVKHAEVVKQLTRAYEDAKEPFKSVTAAVGDFKDGLKGAATGLLERLSPSSLAQGLFGGIVHQIDGFVSGLVSSAVGGLRHALFGSSGAEKNAAREAEDSARAMALQLDAVTKALGHDQLGATIDALKIGLISTLQGINAALPGTKNESARNAARAMATQQEAAQEAEARKQYAQNSQYANEDLAVRNLKATGHTDEATALAFRQQQEREMAQAIQEGREQTYLNTLATVQNNELIAFQNGLLSTALRNAPTGFYGIEGYAGRFATPITPPGWPGDSGPGTGGPDNPRGGVPPLGGGGGQKRPGLGPLTVNVMLPDGRIIGKVFVKDLAQHAASTNGAGSSLSDALETYPH